VSLSDELSEVLPGLRSWALKFSGPHYDVDDLVSDTMIDILEHPWKWVPERGPLRNLMFSMVRNRSMDAKRGYYRGYRQLFRQHLRHGIPLYVMDQPDEEPEAVDWKGKIEQCLEEISKGPAQAFRLFAIEGKSIEEVAQTLAVSRHNAKSMIHRARVKLRLRLKSA
jgi:RNA polymerase sigma factor (sigma-70 family)